MRLTLEWTSIAARMYAAANAVVHRESALLVSELISNGAHQFVGGESRREEAEANLIRFILNEIKLEWLEDSPRPPIGESTFDKTENSLCPLWPFC